MVLEFTEDEEMQLEAVKVGPPNCSQKKGDISSIKPQKYGALSLPMRSEASSERARKIYPKDMVRGTITNQDVSNDKNLLYLWSVDQGSIKTAEKCSQSNNSVHDKSKSVDHLNFVTSWSRFADSRTNLTSK